MVLLSPLCFLCLMYVRDVCIYVMNCIFFVPLYHNNAYLLSVDPTLVLEVWVHAVAPSVASVPEMSITPLLRAAHSYGHGGFMGGALAMLQDDVWRDIFRSVDHSAYHKSYLYGCMCFVSHSVACVWYHSVVCAWYHTVLC